VHHVQAMSARVQVFSLAPQYLAEPCVPVADILGHHNLCSATRELLNLPQYNMKNYN